MTNVHAAGAETHVSWVLFAGEHAYKIKKPIRTEFLDFTTVERRLAACKREVELNRRLTPRRLRRRAVAPRRMRPAP